MPSWLNNMLSPIQEILDRPEMLHAATVHFPLALAVIGLPIALLSIPSWKHVKPIRVAALICYVATVIASLIAVNTGESAHALIPSTLPEYVWSDINNHEFLAERIAYVSAITAICFAISLAPRKKTATVAATAAFLGAATTLAIVLQTGHQGGVLVYEHGLGTPPIHVEIYELAGIQRAAVSVTESNETKPLVMAETREISYADEVQPILQEYCYGCHSEIEKEGGLDLTSLEGILAGGEKDGPPIVFGDPAGSPLIEYVRGTRSPRMPKDEPPLSESHIAILEQWVRSANVESIRDELIMANGDSSILDRTPVESPKTLDSTMEAMLKISRSNPNPLQNISVELLLNRIAFVAQRNKGKTDPLNDTRDSISEDEKPIDKTDETPLDEFMDALTVNQQHIFNEDGERIWPNQHYLNLLRDLRLADLGERVSPPDRSKGTTLNESYSLLDIGMTRQLRRDLRKRWVPVPPAVPELPTAVNPIDAFVLARLNGAGIDHSFKSVPDEVFLKRVYLDIIGVIPPMATIQSFSNDQFPDKRAKLIDTLLANNEGYAANWVPFWEDALCSSPSSNVIAVMGIRGDYRSAIYEAFVQNEPFDEWVAGLIDPFDIDSPSTYILRGNRVELIQSVSNVAQVFMGTGMKCAACHNHFSNPEWTQTRYLEFASFFNGEDLELIRCEQPSGQYLSPKFPWDLPGLDSNVPSGADARFARVSRVSRLLTDPTNPRFTRSIINRLWKRYLGLGFFEPADDYREDSYVSHPDLLDWLTDDLIKHNYDLKHTIRLILNSKTYQQVYRPEQADSFSMNSPDDERYFRSPQLRRLWTEQFYDSLRAATAQPWQGEARAYQSEEVTSFMAALGRPQSRDEVSTYRLNEIGIVSGLELLNSEEYHALIYESPRIKGMAQGWRSGHRTMAGLTKTLYLSFYGRLPTEEEARATEAYLTQAVPNASMPIKAYENAVGDVAWALSTSPEFQYIH